MSSVADEISVRAFYFFRAWADRLDDEQCAAKWDGMSIGDRAEWTRRVREYEAQVPLDHVAAATGYRAGYVQGFANALTKTTNALHHLRIPAEHEVRYPYGEAQAHSPNQATSQERSDG